MMKLILGLLMIAIVGFVALAASRPDEFVVTRSAVFAAPADKIFPHINNLHLWGEWSPWARLDRTTKATFNGPDAGVGASMRWESKNDQVGIGTMTITESKPAEKITMTLELEKPVIASNITEFTFKPSGNGTEVTWSMHGKTTLVTKMLGLIFNCEKMVGEMYEQGFTNLKAVIAR